jgi:hypothetical protein
MQMSNRVSFMVFFGATLIAGGSLCVACVTEDADPTDGTGGDAGTGGMGPGGDTGVAGSSATGTGGGPDIGAVACPAIGAALLTDFTYDAATSDGVQANFGVAGESFAGGTLQYPDTLVSDVTNDNWHISGTVADYTGFGFYFQDACDPLDASGYQGLQFTISGTLPTGRTLSMWVKTSANEIPASWILENTTTTDAKPNSGTCIPASAQYDGTCKENTATVPVTEAPQLVALNWEDFSGGSPQGSITPDTITGFGFQFSWGGDTDTPYEVDVVLDDLGFIE